MNSRGTKTFFLILVIQIHSEEHGTFVGKEIPVIKLKVANNRSDFLLYHFKKLKLERIFIP